MRKMRTARKWLALGATSAALALLPALALPGVPGDAGGGLAFAQDTGQPGAGQTPTGPTGGAGQQPGILVPVSAAFVPDMGGPDGGFGSEIIDEGGDIGEGLSNQRVDPDD